MLFRDRSQAGQVLAQRLSHYANDPSVLVCALPRGGVQVAFPVAESLHAPLDVIIVRKLGVPGQEELALGAIASGGVTVLSQDLIEELGISSRAVEALIAHEQHELARREVAYRGNAAAPRIGGRTVIVVDDGIATGATMRAAVAVIKQQKPMRLVIAVPVAAPETSRELAGQVDELICLAQPVPFRAIGQFYEDFRQVTDDEVREMLRRATRSVGQRDTSQVA